MQQGRAALLRGSGVPSEVRSLWGAPSGRGPPATKQIVSGAFPLALRQGALPARGTEVSGGDRLFCEPTQRTDWQRNGVGGEGFSTDNDGVGGKLVTRGPLRSGEGMARGWNGSGNGMARGCHGNEFHWGVNSIRVANGGSNGMAAEWPRR